MDKPLPEDEEEDNDDEEEEEDLDWYEKAKLLLEHVNELSKEMCLYPGTLLSIDKMMKLFKG